MRTSNIFVLDELLYDNMLFNIPIGQTITKEMDIRNYRLGIRTIYSISTTDQIIENTSTVAVTVHLNAKYSDQIINDSFRYLRV
jgi:hypothetical protein